MTHVVVLARGLFSRLCGCVQAARLLTNLSNCAAPQGTSHQFISHQRLLNLTCHSRKREISQQINCLTLCDSYWQTQRIVTRLGSSSQLYRVFEYLFFFFFHFSFFFLLFSVASRCFQWQWQMAKLASSRLTRQPKQHSQETRVQMNAAVASFYRLRNEQLFRNTFGISTFSGD